MDLSKQTADKTDRYPDYSVRPDPTGLHSDKTGFADPHGDKTGFAEPGTGRSDLTGRHNSSSGSTGLHSGLAGDERGCSTLVLEMAAAPDSGAHHDTAIPKPVPGTRSSHDTAISNSVPGTRLSHDTAIPNSVPGTGASHGTETRKVQSAPSETQMPFSLYGDSGSLALRFSKDIPDQIRKMYSLYEYEGGSMVIRAKNFYQQALFMQDYEDDVPWKGNYTYYFPTYHSLTVSQLRGYFSWRTRIRRGEYYPIPTSTAYLYIYELLNGIGADSPMDRIDKIREFETGFLDSGIGDPRMRKNLHRWIFELAVLYNLPPEIAKQYLDPDLIRRDESIAILLHPENHTDEEVFSALCGLGGDKLMKSPAALYPAKGKQLFRKAWLAVSSHSFGEGQDFHTLCFGERKMRPWYPFANAIYYWQSKSEDREYIVNECRIYRCRNGSWLSESFEKLQFDKARFQSFLRETDRMLRLYLKTGRYLKEKEADAWASPIISAVIDEDRRLAEESARPKITIDLSDLDRIRRDALKTRNSLLTEEELEELKPLLTEEAPKETAVLTPEEIHAQTEPCTSEDIQKEPEPCTSKDIQTESGPCFSEDIQPEPGPCSSKDIHTESRPFTSEGNQTEPEPCSSEDIHTQPDLPLDPLQIRILLCLLSGSSPADIIREHHLMPSLVADAVNEAMYDEFGDTVISCDNDELSLVDDYREDLAQMLEGANR